MDSEILRESYHRLARTGPEFGGDNPLANHGPMAVEVLVRRGYGADVPRWLDSYVRRLEELPRESEPVTGQSWPDALGVRRRVGDWTAYFGRALGEAPWREVLATWWPRLLPGIAAGATHGVIRVGHAARTLLGGDESAEAVTELGCGLAYWAARAQPLPASGPPGGDLEPDAAIAGVPRIPRQQGLIKDRLGQLAGLAGWPDSVAALRPPAGPGDARSQLAALVTAGTLRYLTHGHGSPVLLVHVATAPNAVLHALPALPGALWPPSLAAVWSASAAITAAYAPAQPAPPGALPSAPAGPGAAAGAVDRTVRHRDEHVIKFTDTAVAVCQRTDDPRALAAAARAARLISPSRPARP